MKHSQRGFTLVELMVAMAIGTVIILGAGQLFLTTFQTFQNVDKVSRKQEALVFAVSALTEYGRQGDFEHYAITGDQRSSGNETHHYCVLQNQTENQPVVDLARVDDEADCPTLSEANSDGVSHTVTLPVGDCRVNADASCDEIVFIITERNKVITAQGATP
ncbi:PilW family protein [Vreelandella maris]|uniref:Prepilin-type N-terminal cleavage/methylation domain-containing protein n=1 Tax=Vreelandella maris TaxID=2729617 RepID=A0A7Y6RFQ9_9GAMM|nr:prepilin-type N-terminal cleavage/methylation domain-containing protein [Halomonas maris]NVF16202.1 prepilin-type N-terminal cleavage/methylation domain-containing protein [Halomonas maris]|tara:strand:- start:2201 stop:2686 length:486 start_codon:yes stop_codon:yes gene_type:complete